MKKKLFWNEKKAKWYREAMKDSDFPFKIITFLKPFLKSEYTLLDVGTGCGSLAIPLSKLVNSITAIDPSKAMVNEFKKELNRKTIGNISIICNNWNRQIINPHDILLCSNVSTLFSDKEGFLQKISKYAKKYVFLIHGVGPSDNKFFFKELFPVVFNKEFSIKSDFVETYNFFYKTGIYANVKIIDNSFDQKLKHIEEAVDFWKEHMGLENNNWDQYLKEFLKKNLEKLNNGKYIKRIYQKSAIIWWKV